MADWPDFLPSPEYGSIVVGAPVGAVIRTDMDAGPAKQRKRFTAAPRPVTLSFQPVSSYQLAQFEAFYTTDLSWGAVAFNMLHPVSDVEERFRFMAAEEPWTVAPIGRDAYRLDVNLELLP